MDAIIYWLFRGLPRTAFSRFVGWTARRGSRRLHKFAIRGFTRVYGVSWQEAEQHWSEYPTLNDFFVRRLKQGLRPMEEGEDLVVSPTDSVIAGMGRADGERLIQAKGKTYEISTLLGSKDTARWFRDGPYVTLYLRPRDYHRVHTPVSGFVEEVRYIPGDRFPVVPTAVAKRSDLYVRNERIAVCLSSPLGMVGVVMVASVGVGNMTLSWGEMPQKPRRRDGPMRLLDMEGYSLTQGQEFGVFHLGSTVVLLFEKGRVTFRRFKEGDRVVVGQVLAEAL